MTITAPSAPPVESAWSAWLEDRAAGDAPPTHTAEVTLTFVVDLAAPPWMPAGQVGDALRRAVRRFDPSVLLCLVDYEADQLLPGDAVLVGAMATVRPA